MESTDPAFLPYSVRFPNQMKLAPPPSGPELTQLPPDTGAGGSGGGRGGGGSGAGSPAGGSTTGGFTTGGGVVGAGSHLLMSWPGRSAARLAQCAASCPTPLFVFTGCWATPTRNGVATKASRTVKARIVSLLARLGLRRGAAASA